MAKHNTSLGFTLIEVLVTTVIIGIALLGLTSLQLTQLKNTHQSEDGSIAAIYINDMSERIRANIDSRTLYLIGHGVLPTVVDCKTSACTAAEMVTFDLYQWQQEVKGTLPSGAGEITQTTDTITILVRWDQDMSGSTGTNCPVESDQDLDCLSLTLGL
ncbi:type IV pilus modification protein PilV [Thalassotalea aquiviva]|uniref:type IV pilus modification protein PilV n=1 Tax=Thalassotalea aquiviva TaxID=3242415 RepID=UPI00352B7AF8